MSQTVHFLSQTSVLTVLTLKFRAVQGQRISHEGHATEDDLFRGCRISHTVAEILCRHFWDVPFQNLGFANFRGSKIFNIIPIDSRVMVDQPMISMGKSRNKSSAQQGMSQNRVPQYLDGQYYVRTD